MSRGSRILLVTIALVVTGAVFGGLAGVVAFALGETVTEGVDTLGRWPFWVYRIPAFLGAAMGAMVFPIGAWLMMRHVPLGRALIASIIGAVIGGAVGYGWPLWDDVVARSLTGACVGFLVASLVMRRLARTAAGT